MSDICCPSEYDQMRIRLLDVIQLFENMERKGKYTRSEMIELMKISALNAIADSNVLIAEKLDNPDIDYEMMDLISQKLQQSDLQK